MPGIVGFQELRPSPDPLDLLQAMANTLRVRTNDVSSSISDKNTHLGCMQLGTAQHSQPTWNNDHNIAVVMAGEIFDFGEQKKYLQQKGYSIENGSASKFVASLYQEKGEKFVHSLNGAFAIVIWDARHQKLILANDRLGYEPLYYAQTPERFYFSSNIHVLLTDQHLPRTFNSLAMAQMLTFDHVLGNHTFLQNVHLLPPGSLLTFHNGNISIHRYWQLQFPDQYSLRTEMELQEELLFLLRQAMERQKPEKSAAIMLSGGLDSRIVLALLCEKNLDSPLRAFTFGNPDSDDLRFAKELTSQLKIAHDYHRLRPDYLIYHAELGVRLTDGMSNIVHMHMLDNLAQETTQAQIIYKGFLGDALTGYFSYRDLLANYNTDDIFTTFLQRYPIIFHPSIHAQLFSSEFLNQFQAYLMESAYHELRWLAPQRMAGDYFFQFDLLQRQRRSTLNGVRLVRSHAITRTPLYDNDLLDFMLCLPQGYRLDRYLIIQAFAKAFPDLAKIPSTANGYPLIPCRRELFMRLNNHFRWRLRAAGLKVPIRKKRNYASYNDWFRDPLLGWVESILLSERFQSRGFFNQKFVRQLLQEQKSGKNHFIRLGGLITIELWLRQNIDSHPQS